MADILIIKYYERLALQVQGTPDAYEQRAIISVVKDSVGERIRLKRIDRRAAISKIHENNLVEALRNRDGVVFDTEGKSFQKKHKGLYVPYSV